jgi:glycosyltransferase involved in cell wall biosynthesis
MSTKRPTEWAITPGFKPSIFHLGLGLINHDIEELVSSNNIINVDYTHVARRASGIERVTVEQFSGNVLSPLQLSPLAASYKNRISVFLAQMIGLPLHALRHSDEIYIFPGFPPSPYFAFSGACSVLFVHDLFLLTRRSDLNSVGRYYLAPLFYLAIKNFKYFLTVSENTARELKAYCSPDAQIVPFRPYVRNVFGLAEEDRVSRPARPRRLRVVSVGTIEPRKNFPEAAQICEALASRLGGEVELHIIGRAGWGPDVNWLRDRPNVILHGYVDDAAARSIISASDLMLCTSHDEGLCLPLIEVQYSGVPVVAPDKRIFREVLGSSGIFVKTHAPEQAAKQIADVTAVPSWRVNYAAASRANIIRWNAIAENDRPNVISFLSRLASGRVQGSL